LNATNIAAPFKCQPLLVLAASERPLPGRASCAYVEADGVVSQRLVGQHGDITRYKALAAGADDGIFHPRCNGLRLDALMCRLPSAGFVPGQLPTEGTWLMFLRQGNDGWLQAGAVEIWSDPAGVSCVLRLQGPNGRLQPFTQALRLDDEIGRMDLADPRAWRHVGRIAATHLLQHRQAVFSPAISSAPTGAGAGPHAADWAPQNATTAAPAVRERQRA
jgi:hypothetical protein